MKKVLTRALVVGGAVAAVAADAADSLFSGLTDSATAVASQAKTSSVGISTAFIVVVVVLVGIGLIWRFLQKKS